MKSHFKYCLFIFLLVVTSCQKREWNNPFDPECPKEIFTPSGLTATQEGNQIKLSWNQKNNQITGFIISRNENNGQWSEVAKIPNNPTTYIHVSPVGGVKYGYQVVAYAGSNKSYPVQTSITALAVPTITTTAQTNVASTSAVLGGNVINDGGSPVIERGIVYKTSTNPTISDNKILIGSGTGAFSQTITGIHSNTTYYIRAFARNIQGISYGNEVTFKTKLPCVSFTVTHVAGVVAPVTKTIKYDVVELIFGGQSKCFLAQNLGASVQAKSVFDTTIDAIGWFWQFNRRQGYSHDGTTRIPNTVWIKEIDEDSNWLESNDPCFLLLGSGWRIGTDWTHQEIGNIWTNYLDAFNSPLKLHSAGFLSLNLDGNRSRVNSWSVFWSRTQSGSQGHLYYATNESCFVGTGIKAHAFPIRCIRD